MVLRMKDLATQHANGTTTAADKTAIKAESDALKEELESIMTNTTFGGQALLEGGGFTAAVTFQIGASKAEKLDVDVSTPLGKVTTAIGALTETDLDKANDLLNALGETRSAFGANINRLEHTVNNLSNMKENTDMANGRIMDADFAQESTNMTKNQMLMQAGMSVLSNSNQMTGMVTSLLR